MVYFISDLHLGHKNIINYCNRPFLSVEDMDKQIVERWNMKVGIHDKVYILGDITLEEEKVSTIKELNGEKHLIIGNHDYCYLDKIVELKCFKSISYMEIINLDGKIITLSHFPMPAFIGEYLIYGHVHNNFKDKNWKMVRKKPNTLNACVEINDYEPVTFDELKNNNKKIVSLHK